MSQISNRKQFCTFNKYGIHKGFYNDGDPRQALLNVRYTEFWEFPDDDEFPYWSAESLLCGSCNHFVVALYKLMGYSPYIIEGKNKKGFHAFCQIYRNRQWYYVDARGITSSFDEFMEGIKTFVTDEYTIRPVESDDIKGWEEDSNYNEEAYAFSEAVINKYQECYTFEKESFI
jgi:hypothetical protein